MHRTITPGTWTRPAGLAGLMAGAALASLCAVSALAQVDEPESPLLKHSGPLQRIELKPVIKSEPAKVTLKPILIGEPDSAPTPKPEPSTEKSHTSTPRPGPADASAPQTRPIPPADPVKPEESLKPKTVASKPAARKSEPRPKPVAAKVDDAPVESGEKSGPAPDVAAEQNPTTTTAQVAQAGVRQEVPVFDMSRPEFELAQAVSLPGLPSDAPATAPSAPDAPARLAEAKSLLAAGKLAEARETALALAEAAPGAPEAPEARYLAATALQDLGRACDELHDLVLRYPKAPVTRQALARLGEFSFILGRYDEAVKAYAAYRLVETDPGALRSAGLQLAVAALRGGSYDLAEAEYSQLLARYPELKDQPDVIEGLAESHLATGRIADAAQAFQSIDSRFPNYEAAVKVMMGRGLCAELLGRPAEALAHYERIVNEYPQSVEAGLAGRRRDDLARPLVPGA